MKKQLVATIVGLLALVSVAAPAGAATRQKADLGTGVARLELSTNGYWASVQIRDLAPGSYHLYVFTGHDSNGDGVPEYGGTVKVCPLVVGVGQRQVRCRAKGTLNFPLEQVNLSIAQVVQDENPHTTVARGTFG